VSVRAKKKLGQHFLVDENILGVIGRLAELDSDDVVLEIGPGLGVLTTYLADRVAQVYAVELDTSLGPKLTELLAGRPNVQLRFGDAVKLDLAEAAPGAKKLVANLPYNVATPLIAESLDRLPGIELWTVMVQREVADRFFAKPSTKAYGAVSVLVQLVAERTGLPPSLTSGVSPKAERRLCARRLPPHRSAARLPSRQTSGRRLVRAQAQAARELARARRSCSARPRGGGDRADRQSAERPRRRAHAA